MRPPLPVALAVFALCAALLPPASGAQADAAKCYYVQAGSLPLHYTGPSLSLTTEGSINGTPATMLVDTGAFDTLLTTTGTDRHQLFMRATSHYVRGIGGDTRLYEAQVREISAGPAQGGRTWLPVLADFGFVPAFDAIIGAPFLLQADLEISLAAKQLRFFRPSNCGERFLAYWDEHAMEIPFEAGGDRSANPRFTVLVNGQKMRAMIDTGADSTVIGLKAAQRAGLKLDAPGLTRLLDTVGVGASRVARWSTSFDTFQIGEEIVRNAEVGVIDWEDHVDILLGADFLRAHRVLFAMSQRKIYLLYVGGEPFGQRRKLEPWIVQEAEAGNGDAQMVLAQMYSAGRAVPKDAALAADWLEKAARGGNPEANVLTGRALMQNGSHEAAVARLRSAVDKLPPGHTAALSLYLARVRNKQADLAKTELAAHAARAGDKAWPAPLADFYLGRITAEALLERARAEAVQARTRTCESLAAMWEWHGAHGDQAAAQALLPQRQQHCAPAAAKG